MIGVMMKTYNQLFYTTSAKKQTNEVKIGEIFRICWIQRWNKEFSHKK